ncbi:MAG: NUDIX hydrolase [Pseudomonadota bacterium]
MSASPEAASDKSAVRDAATVILLRRDTGQAPRILMGQRGAGAAFMPSKFVFPGGAVDQGDRALPTPDLPPGLAARLSHRAEAALAPALALAAVRELWEETGLILGTASDGTAPPGAGASWGRFFATGRGPKTAGLDFVCRAITPPGRPRRFDARFFLADAADLASDPDDFSDADAELAHLRWLTLPEARQLDLPFITEIVLAELDHRLRDPDPGRPVPFFHHSGGRSFIDGL